MKISYQNPRKEMEPALSAVRSFLFVLCLLFAAVASSRGATISVPGDYATIQAAVNAAAAGDVIDVSPGTYAENIVSTIPLTIQGAGLGTIIAPAGGVAVSLAAGSNETVRSVLRNLSISGEAGSITGIVAGSHSTIENVVSSGHSNYGINLNPGTDLIVTDSRFDGNAVGLKISSTASFSGITVSGSSFDNNSQHGWYSDASKTTMPVLDDIHIAGTTFSGNGLKGFYTERLSNALFDQITVADNANSAGFNFGAGMDLNLKWRSDYVSITIQDSSFTNNGNGSLNGVALTIKARDDAPSYNNPAAALSGVLIIRTIFDNNERHYVAGEPGKMNSGPADVVIEGSSFGSSQSGSVINYTNSVVDANLNYWGAAVGPSGISGNVNAVAYYADGGFSTVFAPVINITRSTYFATIQSAIDAATTGDTIEVSAGTFVEDVLINKAVSLKGAGVASTTLSGPVGGGLNTIQIAASNVAVSGFTITREGNSPATWNDPALNSAGVGLQSAVISNVVVHDNLISGMRTGIDVNNTNSVTIRNNVITNNRTGLILRNRTDDLVVEENEITGNWTVGILFLDASSGSNSPLQQAVGSVFTNNIISGNWYGQIVDRQTGGSLPAPGLNLKDFTGNWLGSLVPSLSTANSAEPGYSDQIPVVFGGTAVAPLEGSQADILGSASANIAFTPLLASGADTDLETSPGRGTYGFQGAQGELDAPVKITTIPATPVFFATLAQALAAAVPGDVIELSPGTHTGPNLDITKAVTIVGANAGLAGTSITRGPESRILNMKLTITVAGVVIDGVEIYQTNNTSDAVLLNAAATVKNSILRRFGVSTGTFARAITTAVGVSGYAVENNLFSGDLSGGLFGGHKTWNSGLYLNGGTGSVTGNTFEICRAAINADDFNAGISISGNTFRTNGTYLSFGGTAPTTGSHTIAGNEFGFDFTLPPASNPTLFNASNVAPAFRLNVIGNTFGGIASGDLTTAQKFAIEARNFHRGRAGRNGVVDFVSGEQVVVTGTTIQSAINAAAAGGSVLVGPGTYAENVSVDKGLTLRGANFGVAAGNVAGLRLPEAVIDGSITLSSSNVSIDGFEIVGSGSAIGTPGGGAGPFVNIDIRNNRMVGKTGGQVVHNGVFVGGTTVGSANWSLVDNYVGNIQANAATAFLLFDIDGLAVSGNRIDHTNAAFTGRRGVNLDGNRNVLFSNNRVNMGDVSPVDTSGSPWAVQVSMSNRSVEQVNVSGNLIENSFYGIVGLSQRSITGLVISENTIAGTAHAIALNSGSGAPVAAGVQFDGVEITGNLITSSLSSVRIRNLHAASPNGPVLYGVVNVSENSFLSSGGIIVEAGASLASGALDADRNYWNASSGPSGVGVGSGASSSADVAFSPWYADAGLTILVTAVNFEDFTVDPGQTVTFDDLLVGSGTTWTVKGSLNVSGQFVLEDGAVLEVVDGDITFADGSTMSGTFTFFNSFGSINFDDDVTITGSAEGLILVSDVHVADGATITVDGTFTIDGCTVDSSGTFDLVINAGADFTMARTAFSDGTITVNSGETEIYDNRLTDMDLDVTGLAGGARIFHNILSPTADIDDSGVGTVVVVDAWGNVTSAANTENNLPLTLELEPALITGNRTIDANGVAYIQPGDAISAAFSVSELQNKIVGLELLLGYNTDLLSSSSLGLGTNWDDVMPFTEVDGTNVIGRFNAAIGLDFTFPDPSGTITPQTVGDLGLVAGNTEGTTQVFHRVKIASDTVPGTRLSKGLPETGYLTPFTSNSPAIVIDNTDPLTNSMVTGATIQQSGQDMTQFITLQGSLEISASAFDALAGIDDADAVVTLVGPTTYTATQVLVTNPGPTIGSDVYTTYGFEYDVTSTTLNGDYDVVFTVTDRSGNSTTSVLGEITINKNQLTTTLELEGLVVAPVTRNVTFVFTDAGAVLETRTESVVFTNGVGTVTFTDVNGETDQISAKTATHLRERLPVVFTDGQASVSYTGAGELPGGDLNGDNIVNLLDYAVLKFYWLNVVGTVPAAAAAEITGDGSVNLTDYQILQSNFYQQGDPQ